MGSNQTQENFNSLGVSVADHISAIMAYWDKDQVCRYANAAYIEWFGKTKEEMVDKITLAQLLGPSVYVMNLPYITGVLEGKAQSFERELPIPLGGMRHTLANYFPDIINGEVVGFFAHVADITPVKLLENELSRSNEVVKEQNNLLLNFANIVSHNLKSYAGNLNAIVDMLIKADAEDLRNEMLGYLQKIAKGFGQTVNNLNEIAKAQNFSKTNPEHINLKDYIEKAIEILRIQVKSTDATILNQVNPAVTLYTNPVYMESILLNLLTNAIKYRHPERQSVIELDSTADRGDLQLVIKDNGLGINLEKYGKSLFGLYQTFHKNADAQGVGLYIVKFQVESMGGRIEVESEVDKGTAFKIYFKMG
jgi:PAS domain S-box-containing protein